MSIPLDEERLLAAAKTGDESAFNELYSRYIQIVYRFIYTRCGNREEAEDLTAETFTKLAKSIGNFAGRSTFKTWLLGIARHTLLDYWRRHYKVSTVSLDEFLANGGERDIATSDSFTEDHERRNLIDSMLNKLPVHYREVLSLRFLKGYSLRETANEMNKSVDNIKVLQYRALKKARQIGSSA